MNSIISRLRAGGPLVIFFALAYVLAWGVLAIQLAIQSARIQRHGAMQEFLAKAVSQAARLLPGSP
jgi:hypothetical protein